MAVRRRNGQSTPGEGSKVRSLDVYADDWSDNKEIKPRKAGRGKGMKKELLPFDFINVVGSNPPPSGRVDTLRMRFEKGLDFWTGQPLKPVDMADNDN